jgi:hypothetical protein
MEYNDHIQVTIICLGTVSNSVMLDDAYVLLLDGRVFNFVTLLKMFHWTTRRRDATGSCSHVRVNRA